MVLVLHHSYGFSEQVSGIIISVPSALYMITGNLVGLIANRAPRRIFILIAIASMFISALLMGQSDFLGLPKDKSLLLIGLCFNGIG